ncbi:MAG: FAD:protein FMN transferase [Porticoccaceae bacterium]|nr:FAD:protein FMN transferase [Porticoccaceae bacterium]
MTISSSMTSVVNTFGIISNLKARPQWASFLFVRVFVPVLVLGLLVGLSACDSRPGAESKTQPSEFVLAGSGLGTTYHIKILLPAASEQPFSKHTLQDQVDAVISQLDRSMSTYKPDSELNQLNRHPVGQPFAVSADLLEVLLLAEQIYTVTDGAFDPTVGPLVDLWGFGPKITGDRMPTEAEITVLSARVGFDAIDIDRAGAAVSKTADVALDLSAIAKGYVVDRLAELLLELGVDNFMVEVGGELRLSGSNASGKPWKIAVEVPALAQGNIQRVLLLTDTGLATSGDYRNYFEREGVRYSHTIDPRNGYPITHNLASVTVLASTAAEADAFATGFMVLGKAETLRIAEVQGLSVFLLVKDADGFKEYYTSNFKPYLSGDSNGDKGDAADKGGSD